MKKGLFGTSLALWFLLVSAGTYGEDLPDKSAASTPAPFEVGEYLRDGELTPGWLRITSVSSISLQFQLMTELREAADDGERTRNGVVEESEAVIVGASAVYRSNHEEDEDLGVCQLDLQRHKQEIILTQSGKCWWFGEGVDASGTYRKHEFSPELRALVLRETTPARR